MAGYTRQSTFADGDTITAALFNNEYNQLLNAFSNTGGHKHDGTANEGPVIGLIGDAGETAPNNKVLIDTTNNYIEFYVQVSGSPVQQLYIADGAIVPVTDNDIDLGTSSLQFKDLYINGTANIDSLVLATGSTVTAVLDEDDLSSDSATSLVTQQSVKAYIDAQVTAQDLDFLGDSGGALSIDLDSESLTIAGGTGLDTVGSGNTVTVNIDATVATLTGSQTLTNKTIDVDNNTVSNIEVDNFKASAIVLESEGIGSNDNDTSLPTSAAVKDYVDTQITAEDLDITTDSGTIAIDLDSETLTVSGGTGLDSSATGNAVTLAIDSTVTTLTGTQTLTNKTLTSPDVNTPDIDGGTIDGATIATSDVTVGAGKTLDVSAGTLTLADNQISGDKVEGGTIAATTITDLTFGSLNDGTITATAFVDEDNMASNSATLIPTQQSVKAYVDTTVAATNEVVEDTTPQLGGDLDLNSNDITGTGNINITGTIQSSGNITGTLATAAQPNITSLGTLTALTVDDITINGSTISDAGDLTLDVAGDIILDADGDDFIFAAGGTNIGKITNSSSDFLIRSLVQDKDIIFKGADGGSTITALTLDMSAAGAATFNAGVTTTAVITGGSYNVGGTAVIDSGRNLVNMGNVNGAAGIFGSLAVDNFTLNGTTLSLSSGDLTLDVANNIILDADGGVVYLNDGGVGFGQLVKNSNDFRIFNPISDGDIVFRGNDGGSVISALTLDMSDAGTAIFNNNLVIPASIYHTGDTNTFFGFPSADTFTVNTSGSERMRIDSSGNVGIGVTPETDWHSNYKALQLNTGGAIASYADSTTLGTAISTNQRTTGNTFINENKYIVNGAASLYLQDNVGKHNFYTAASGSADATITWVNTLKIDASGVLINEDSNDQDFRVESNGNTHMLFVDGGNDRIGIGHSAPATILDIHGTSPTLNIRDLTSAATGVGGAISLQGYTSGTGSPNNFGKISGTKASGNVGGVLTLSTSATNGTMTDRMTISESGAATFNSTIAATSATFTASTASMTLAKPDEGNFSLSFDGSNSNIASNSSTATINFQPSSTTRMTLAVGGTLTTFPLADKPAVFNENGVDADFRVESDGNDHMLFVDGGLNKVGIGTSSLVSTSLPLSLGSRTGSPLNYLNGTSDTISTSTGIFVSHSESGTSNSSMGLQLANNDNTVDAKSPVIAFSAKSASGSYQHTYATIYGEKVGNGADTNWNTGRLVFGVSDGTGSDDRMILNQVGGLSLYPNDGGHTVFNEGSSDADFRVESNANTHALFVDAGDDAVRVNTSAAIYSGGEKMSISSTTEGLGIKTTTATKQCLGLYNSDAGGARHFVRFALGSSGTEVGNITSTGSTTAYNTSSDARLKDVTGSARGLEVINELNPVSYNWKADGQADEGLIAQEVLDIVPNAVSGSEEDMYQMDYSKLVVHLVAGMKEQQTQIDALQSEINLLKGE